MAQQRVGGSFAPPLSDEKFAEYKKLLDRMESSPQKDCLKSLFPGCETWWELPEANGTAVKPHPVGHVATPLGEIVIPQIVSLQADHKEAIDPHLPWREDIEVAKGRFAPIEEAAAFRNGQKMQAWRISVVNAITARDFPEPGLYQKVCEAMKSAGVWLGLLPDDVRKTFEERQRKVLDTIAQIHVALATKTYPDIPLPSLEPCPLRDAAHHLLWHVAELDLEREPITTDRLR